MRDGDGVVFFKLACSLSFYLLVNVISALYNTYVLPVASCRLLVRNSPKVLPSRNFLTTRSTNWDVVRYIRVIYGMDIETSVCSLSFVNARQCMDKAWSVMGSVFTAECTCWSSFWSLEWLFADMHTISLWGHILLLAVRQLRKILFDTVFSREDKLFSEKGKQYLNTFLFYLLHLTHSKWERERACAFVLIYALYRQFCTC